jgi:hypothetical protein
VVPTAGTATIAQNASTEGARATLVLSATVRDQRMASKRILSSYLEWSVFTILFRYSHALRSLPWRHPTPPKREKRGILLFRCAHPGYASLELPRLKQTQLGVEIHFPHLVWYHTT